MNEPVSKFQLLLNPVKIRHLPLQLPETSSPSSHTTVVSAGAQLYLLIDCQLKHRTYKYNGFEAYRYQTTVEAFNLLNELYCCSSTLIHVHESL